MKRVLFLLLGLFLQGCSSSSSPSSSSLPKGEYLFRRYDESLVQVESMAAIKRKSYPWEEDWQCCYPKITKDFFRCRGSSLNPVHFAQKGKEVVRFYDCGGAQKHSLPLRDQKEYI